MPLHYSSTREMPPERGQIWVLLGEWSLSALQTSQPLLERTGEGTEATQIQHGTLYGKGSAVRGLDTSLESTSAMVSLRRASRPLLYGALMLSRLGGDPLLASQWDCRVLGS
jgi:hypothetical protein